MKKSTYIHDRNYLQNIQKKEGYKDPAYRATVKQFKGKKVSKEEFAQALAMHHQSMDESLNEKAPQIKSKKVSGTKDVYLGIEDFGGNSKRYADFAQKVGADVDKRKAHMVNLKFTASNITY